MKHRITKRSVSLFMALVLLITAMPTAGITTMATDITHLIQQAADDTSSVSADGTAEVAAGDVTPATVPQEPADMNMQESFYTYMIGRSSGNALNIAIDTSTNKVKFSRIAKVELNDAASNNQIFLVNPTTKTVYNKLTGYYVGTGSDGNLIASTSSKGAEYKWIISDDCTTIKHSNKLANIYNIKAMGNVISEGSTDSKFYANIVNKKGSYNLDDNIKTYDLALSLKDNGQTAIVKQLHNSDNGGSADQMWEFEPQVNGTYRIKNVATGKYLHTGPASSVGLEPNHSKLEVDTANSFALYADAYNSGAGDPNVTDHLNYKDANGNDINSYRRNQYTRYMVIMNTFGYTFDSVNYGAGDYKANLSTEYCYNYHYNGGTNTNGSGVSGNVAGFREEEMKLVRYAQYYKHGIEPSAINGRVSSELLKELAVQSLNLQRDLKYLGYGLNEKENSTATSGNNNIDGIIKPYNDPTSLYEERYAIEQFQADHNIGTKSMRGMADLETRKAIAEALRTGDGKGTTTVTRVPTVYVTGKTTADNSWRQSWYVIKNSKGYSFVSAENVANGSNYVIDLTESTYDRERYNTEMGGQTATRLYPPTESVTQRFGIEVQSAAKYHADTLVKDDEFIAYLYWQNNNAAEDKYYAFSGVGAFVNDNGVEVNQELKVKQAEEGKLQEYYWRFTRQTDGSYKIFSEYFESQCLTKKNGLTAVPDTTMAAANKVWLDWDAAYDNNATDIDEASQHWYIYNKDGRYIIQSKLTGEVLKYQSNAFYTVTIAGENGSPTINDGVTTQERHTFMIKKTDLTVETALDNAEVHLFNYGSGINYAADRVLPFSEVLINNAVDGAWEGRKSALQPVMKKSLRGGVPYVDALNDYRTTDENVIAKADRMNEDGFGGGKGGSLAYLFDPNMGADTNGFVKANGTYTKASDTTGHYSNLENEFFPGITKTDSLSVAPVTKYNPTSGADTSAAIGGINKNYTDNANNVFIDSWKARWAIGDGTKGSAYQSQHFAVNSPSSLFQKADNGKLYYDSTKNAAYFNQETSQFEVFDYVYRRHCFNYKQTEATDGKMAVVDGNFFPFNLPHEEGEISYKTGAYNADYKDTKEQVKDADGAWKESIRDSGDEVAYRQKYSEKASEGVDGWFGMSIETDFFLPSSYKQGTEDIMFNFAGDDDVWVYVDDILFLDIGDAHGAREGYIDFTHGIVCQPKVDLQTKKAEYIAAYNTAHGTTYTASNDLPQDVIYEAYYDFNSFEKVLTDALGSSSKVGSLRYDLAKLTSGTAEYQEVYNQIIKVKKLLGTEPSYTGTGLVPVTDANGNQLYFNNTYDANGKPVYSTTKGTNAVTLKTFPSIATPDNEFEHLQHTLNFFFLERGGQASTCKIELNMPTGQANITKKVEGINDIITDDQEYTFRIEEVIKDENGKITGYEPLDSNTVYQKTSKKARSNSTVNLNDDGTFTLKNDETVTFMNLINGKRYVVREIKTTDANKYVESILWTDDSGKEADRVDIIAFTVDDSQVTPTYTCINTLKTTDLDIRKVVEKQVVNGDGTTSTSYPSLSELPADTRYDVAIEFYREHTVTNSDGTTSTEEVILGSTDVPITIGAIKTGTMKRTAIAKLEDIPLGVKYRVWETTPLDNENRYYAPKYNYVNGTYTKSDGTLTNRYVNGESKNFYTEGSQNYVEGELTLDSVLSSTGTVSCARVTNTIMPEGYINIDIKYYPREIVNGQVTHISEEPTVYSTLFKISADDAVQNDAGRYTYINFANVIAKAGVEFDNEFEVNSVIENYDMFTTQASAETAMHKKTFIKGNRVYTLKESVYHTGPYGAPQTDPSTGELLTPERAQALSRVVPLDSEKWVNYYSSNSELGGTVDAEAADFTDYNSVTEISVWLFNQPKQYTVNAYSITYDMINEDGTLKEDAEVTLNGTANTRYIKGTASLTQDAYYNQRLGSEHTGTMNHTGTYLAKYGIPYSTNTEPETVKSFKAVDNVSGKETTYKFLQWSYNSDPKYVATTAETYCYRVMGDTNLYAIYVPEDKYENVKKQYSDVGTSLLQASTDVFIEDNKKKITINNVLNPYNTPLSDKNIKNVAVIYLVGDTPYEDSYAATQKETYKNFNGKTSGGQYVSTAYQDYILSKLNTSFKNITSETASKYYGGFYSGFKLSYTNEDANGKLTITGASADQQNANLGFYFYDVKAFNSVEATGDPNKVNLTNENRVMFSTTFDITNLKDRSIMAYAAINYADPETGETEWLISKNSNKYNTQALTGKLPSNEVVEDTPEKADSLTFFETDDGDGFTPSVYYQTNSTYAPTVTVSEDGTTVKVKNGSGSNYAYYGGTLGSNNILADSKYTIKYTATYKVGYTGTFANFTRDGTIAEADLKSLVGYYRANRNVNTHTLLFGDSANALNKVIGKYASDGQNMIANTITPVPTDVTELTVDMAYEIDGETLRVYMKNSGDLHYTLFDETDVFTTGFRANGGGKLGFSIFVAGSGATVEVSDLTYSKKLEVSEGNTAVMIPDEYNTSGEDLTDKYNNADDGDLLYKVNFTDKNSVYNPKIHAHSADTASTNYKIYEYTDSIRIINTSNTQTDLYYGAEINGLPITPDTKYTYTYKMNTYTNSYANNGSGNGGIGFAYPNTYTDDMTSSTPFNIYGNKGQANFYKGYKSVYEFNSNGGYEKFTTPPSELDSEGFATFKVELNGYKATAYYLADSDINQWIKIGNTVDMSTAKFHDGTDLSNARRDYNLAAMFYVNNNTANIEYKDVKIYKGLNYMTEDMTAMSFNVRNKNLDTSQTPDSQANGAPTTAQYKSMVANMIKKYMPDTVGLQEVPENWYTDFENSGLADTYALFGKGRNNGTGEAAPIIYRKDKFTLVSAKSGTKWYTESGEYVSDSGKDEDIGKTIDGKGAADGYPRTYTYAMLKRNSDGKEIMVVNTHLTNWNTQRTVQINRLKAFISQYVNNYPVFVTGDFNTKLSAASYQYDNVGTTNGYDGSDTTNYAALESMEEIGVYNATKVSLDQTDCSDTDFTYTNYGDTANTYAVIDYFFVNTNYMTINSYKVCDDKFSGYYPSDHYPIFMRYNVKKP